MDANQSSDLMFEKGYPACMGLAVFIVYGVAVWLTAEALPPARTIPNLLSAVCTVSSIAVSFLATSRAYMLSIKDRDVMKAVSKSLYYPLLWRYFNGAIRSTLILAPLTILGFFLDWDCTVCLNRGLNRWYMAIWVAWIVYAGTSCQRVIRVFSLLFAG